MDLVVHEISQPFRRGEPHQYSFAQSGQNEGKKDEKGAVGGKGFKNECHYFVSGRVCEEQLQGHRGGGKIEKGGVRLAMLSPRKRY